MPKVDRIELALEKLGGVRRDPTSAASIDALRAALRGRSPHVAAKAAEIAGEGEVGALVAELVAAFERFREAPAKSDPSCVAKTAIVEALDRLGAREEEVFLRGIRHVQLEPVWGGKTDTAVGLRAASAFALVNTGCHEALTPLAELLADPEPRARAAAARAIGASGEPAGVPVLRLKALLGDAESEVLSDCIAGLLQLAPEESAAFAGRFLDAPEGAAREAAALALGGSRRPEAFPVLRDWWQRCGDDESRRTALLAVAMLKTDVAVEFLLGLVREAPGPTARLAIGALELHRYDEALVRRVREAARRDDADLRSALDAAFGA